VPKLVKAPNVNKQAEVVTGSCWSCPKRSSVGGANRKNEIHGEGQVRGALTVESLDAGVKVKATSTIIPVEKNRPVPGGAGSRRPFLV